LLSPLEAGQAYYLRRLPSAHGLIPIESNPFGLETRRAGKAITFLGGDAKFFTGALCALCVPEIAAEARPACGPMRRTIGVPFLVFPILPLA
jgi:hypothetical protein